MGWRGPHSLRRSRTSAARSSRAIRSDAAVQLSSSTAKLICRQGGFISLRSAETRRHAQMRTH